MSKKEHWENVYQTKAPQEVSWTQEHPETSLRLIKNENLAKDAAIIDVGGGDSQLVDFLLEEGYTNLTVLDISSKALETAQERLGSKASLVKWIESDVTLFQPSQKYVLWHDRAAFHFLREQEQITKYKNLVNDYVIKNLVIGTFSKEGPLKCSGLEICQYAKDSITDVFADNFELTDSFTENHTTPFNTEQNFLFSTFKRK